MSKNTQKIIKPWKIVRSRYVLSDKWIKVRADECVTADGTKVSPYYVLEYSNWVHMVVVNKKGQILITKQYRHGSGKIGYEIPCGTMDLEDKNPLETAERELLEETGYSGDFFFVSEVSPNPANHSNKVIVFLVTNPVKVLQPQEDPTEVINCKFIDENKVWKMIDQGKIQQAICISSLVIGLRYNSKLKKRSKTT
jgi:8-oxo-dGTP pyrophosphatase MutT (NUDIX family)